MSFFKCFLLLVSFNLFAQHNSFLSQSYSLEEKKAALTKLVELINQKYPRAQATVSFIDNGYDFNVNAGELPSNLASELASILGEISLVHDNN
jgi:hypothetical protein